jgi:uncharacterized protein (TIGR03083 family)
MSESIWPTVHAERHALADDLAQLTDEQWRTPSLCRGWSVHDVLAHLVDSATMTPPKFLVKFAAAGFNFSRFTARQIAAMGAGGPAATLAAFRAAADRTSSPPGPKTSWLGETLVHAEDIRRPLQIAHDCPKDAAARALRFYAGSNTLIGGKNRVTGLTLRATDTELAIGSGPEVAGPVMSLLLATTGRTGALDELSGPGVDTLRSRS